MHNKSTVFSKNRTYKYSAHYLKVEKQGIKMSKEYRNYMANDTLKFGDFAELLNSPVQYYSKSFLRVT